MATSAYLRNVPGGLNEFYKQNEARIKGIATANKVDEGQARDMFVSNVLGKSNYSGAGVANMSDLNKQYTNALTYQRTANEQRPKSGGSVATSPYVETDVEKLKQQYIQSQLAQLDINKNNQQTAIDNAYRKNLTAYDQQKGLVGQQHQEAVAGANQSTFDQLRYSKELGANRGITNSAQMQAQDRAVMREGNNQVYAAQMDRDNAVNNIQKMITDLGAAYGADKATLEANYGSAKLKAMSDGELMALETQLKVDTFNAQQAAQFKLAEDAYKNQVNLAQMGQGFTQENMKLQNQFDQDMMKASQQFQASQNAISRSAASAAQKQAMTIQNNIGYAETLLSSWLTSNPNAPASQKNAANAALYRVTQGGDPSAMLKLINDFTSFGTPMV